MRPRYLTALRRAKSLLSIMLSSPEVTLRLLTWARVKNACRVMFLRQGNLGLLLQRYSAIYNVNPKATDSVSMQPAEGYVGDVVFFPAIDWGFRFQRPQHLARELGARGFRVFYVSTVPLLIPGRSDYMIQGEPSPGVVLVQFASGSFRIPDFYRESMTEGEVAGFVKSYGALCQDFGIEHPSVLVQQPFWWSLASQLQKSRLVYDCLDHHAGFHDQPYSCLIENERQLIDAADVVVATSEGLAEDIRKSRLCELIRNGCEYGRFSQAVCEKSSVGRPIIGYVGAVSEWFDGQLLFEIAQTRPDWQFDIYGATVGADISPARSLPNVNFLGEIPYESVPSAVACFDVCIIPFRIVPLTLATNPVKVYEYLASGRPVVSTALPELAGMEDVDVFCAVSAADFIAKIELALSCSDQADRISVRQEFARANDWSNRVDEWIRLL